MAAAIPRGAYALILAQLFRAATLFLGLVVLSRILTPADFGCVAVATAIVGVGEIVRDLGLSAAAITQPDLQPHQRDLLFWINFGIGILLAVLAIALAPLLGVIFSSPPLAEVLPVLSSVFVINGWNAQYRADLNRVMRFRALAVTDAVSPLVGVLAAIVLALVGAGYWALIAQQVVAAALAAVIVFAMDPRMPHWPRRARESVDIIRFGVSVTWAQVLTYVASRLDVFALGYWVSPTQLGYYTRAFQSTIYPLGLLRNPLASIAMPLLSRRRDDPRRFGDAAATGQKLVSYTVVPIAAAIAGCSAPLVLVVLGPQWAATIPVVMILALTGLFQMLVSVSNWMFLSGNYGKQLRRYSTLALLVKAALVLIAAPFGIVAVATAYLASTILLAPYALWSACRAARVPLMRMAIGVVRPLIVALLAGLVAWLMNEYGPQMVPILQLVVSGTLFVSVYALAAVIPTYRRDYRFVIDLLRRGRKKGAD